MALLAFSFAGKAMANPTGTVGDDNSGFVLQKEKATSTQTGGANANEGSSAVNVKVKDALNGNQLDSNNTKNSDNTKIKDSYNNKDLSTNASDGALAFGGVDNTVGTVWDIKVGNVKVIASVNTLSNEVSGNKLSFGKDLSMSNDSTGNTSDKASVKSKQNSSSAQLAVNAMKQENKAAAFSAAKQKGTAVVVPINAAVNVPSTTSNAGAATSTSSLTSTSNATADATSDPSDNRDIYGDVKAKAGLKSSDKDPALAASLSKAKSFNSVGAATADTNSAYNQNSANVASSNGAQSNTATQDNSNSATTGQNEASLAAISTTGDYSNTETQTVSLATGSNCINGVVTANGINPIAMNSGIQSSIQQQINVTAAVTANNSYAGGLH